MIAREPVGERLNGGATPGEDRTRLMLGSPESGEPVLTLEHGEVDAGEILVREAAEVALPGVTGRRDGCGHSGVGGALVGCEALPLG